MAFQANLGPTFPRQPNVGSVTVTAAETTTPQTVYTAGANGSKILGMVITSIDTANKDIVISRNNGSAFTLATISVPLTAGTADSIPPVNGFAAAAFPGLPVDSDGNPFLYLASGDTLQCAALVTLTAAKTISITVFAVDF